MKDINRAIGLLNRFLQIREYYMLEKYKTVTRWQFIKLFGNFFTYYITIECKTAGERNENLFYFIDNELISKVEY